jgi:acetyl-CoA carboxylase carboxyl transferase subunit alpha
MQYLDFEKPIESLYEEIEKLKEVGEKTKVDMSSAIKEMESKIETTKRNLF